MDLYSDTTWERKQIPMPKPSTSPWKPALEPSHSPTPISPHVGKVEIKQRRHLSSSRSQAVLSVSSRSYSPLARPRSSNSLDVSLVIQHSVATHPGLGAEMSTPASEATTGEAQFSRSLKLRAPTRPGAEKHDAGGSVAQRDMRVRDAENCVAVVGDETPASSASGDVDESAGQPITRREGLGDLHPAQQAHQARFSPYACATGGLGSSNGGTPPTPFETIPTSGPHPMTIRFCRPLSQSGLSGLSDLSILTYSPTSQDVSPPPSPDSLPDSLRAEAMDLTHRGRKLSSDTLPIPEILIELEGRAEHPTPTEDIPRLTLDGESVRDDSDSDKDDDGSQATSDTSSITDSPSTGRSIGMIVATTSKTRQEEQDPLEGHYPDRSHGPAIHLAPETRQPPPPGPGLGTPSISEDTTRLAPTLGTSLVRRMSRSFSAMWNRPRLQREDVPDGSKIQVAHPAAVDISDAGPSTMSRSRRSKSIVSHSTGDDGHAASADTPRAGSSSVDPDVPVVPPRPSSSLSFRNINPLCSPSDAIDPLPSFPVLSVSRERPSSASQRSRSTGSNWLAANSIRGLGRSLSRSFSRTFDRNEGRVSVSVSAPVSDASTRPRITDRHDGTGNGRGGALSKEMDFAPRKDDTDTQEDKAWREEVLSQALSLSLRSRLGKSALHNEREGSERGLLPLQRPRQGIHAPQVVPDAPVGGNVPPGEHRDRGQRGTRTDEDSNHGVEPYHASSALRTGSDTEGDRYRRPNVDLRASVSIRIEERTTVVRDQDGADGIGPRALTRSRSTSTSRLFFRLPSGSLTRTAPSSDPDHTAESDHDSDELGELGISTSDDSEELGKSDVSDTSSEDGTGSGSSHLSHFTIINRPPTTASLHYGGMIDPNRPLGGERHPLPDQLTHPGLGLSTLGSGLSGVLNDQDRERVRRAHVLEWRNDVRDAAEELGLEGRILRHVEREREVMTRVVARGVDG